MLDYEFAKENKIVEITRKDGKKCILSKHFTQTISSLGMILSHSKQRFGNNTSKNICS